MNFVKASVNYFDYRFLPIKRNPKRIETIQKESLRRNYSNDVKKLILFLNRGYDTVSGGILAATWTCNQTSKLRHIHGADVIMCTLPGDPPLLRYTKFENQNYIYTLSQALSYFTALESLMIHIPEYAVGQFIREMSREDYEKLKKIGSLHFNIGIQNVKLLGSRKDLDELRKIATVTCTTGHERYSTPRLREELGVPVHKLSVWVSPEQYTRTTYAEKQNLMVVSPDIHPRKGRIMKLIRNSFPELRVRVVENLTYSEYKRLISQAKWSLTFGEGLDGYFVETVFSGGIAFAAYNSDFFTDDFKELRTVYENYGTLSHRVCVDLRELDNEAAYVNYQSRQYAMCAKYYDAREYSRNLELFYKGQYTYK